MKTQKALVLDVTLRAELAVLNKHLDLGYEVAFAVPQAEGLTLFVLRNQASEEEEEDYPHYESRWEGEGNYSREDY